MFDLARCAWDCEEKRQAKQEREDEKRWNRKLKSVTSKEIEESMKTEHEAEKRIKEDEKCKGKLGRWHKFDAMFEEEADRWTEELTRAAGPAPEGYPYVQIELGGDHRRFCMPGSYTFASRSIDCQDCKDDEEMARKMERSKKR
ncbi:predicted protein [Sclerotinia sclerotiorum 1980 UF-70]|uniref:Uncharacterized protein n=2 Tax=Sclerotinia sclerotiorum (strain ATCC 18683 / 1980 / Ss-1) TaxID=665079 RepID=A7F783_SCLS1|nr:predicted protein [Sclerotinia sclerotiorum 1980 UF-70]APA15513.1 hypothetical protein sscle_15g102830 [Sclerotinia sclerotiorum 1980 UF-70]EDN98604.1 predicted protein [Sclerotinia sclerotiorum 1980 UF-70]